VKEHSLKRRLLRAVIGVTSLTWSAAAQAQLPPRTGTEWVYGGVARQIRGTDAPVVQPLVTWATVVGQSEAGLEVVRYRRLPEDVSLPMRSAVWLTATNEENTARLQELRISREVRLADSLNLPAPFGPGLTPGETKIVRVPLFGLPLPYPQTVPLRRRVLGEETVDGRLCLRVERKLAARLPLAVNGFSILEYVEQLWVERGSGALVRFEGRARIREGNDQEPVTILATDLRLEQVRTLSEEELKQRREHGERLAAIANLLPPQRNEPSEGRLREALGRLQAFRREAPNSPYRAAMDSLEELIRGALDQV
jgi:hypothetical protein